MKPDALRHIIRAILILIVQVLILKRMSAGSSWLWQHTDLFIYPVIILLLPIRMARHYVILLGFAIGLIIDMFYDTVGREGPRIALSAPCGSIRFLGRIPAEVRSPRRPG